MTAFPSRAPTQLLAFLTEHRIDAEFVAPGVPMPTVLAAAVAMGAPPERILKTLLFTGDEGAYVIAIANGTSRIDRARLAKVANLTRPRAANPEAVFVVTGYPAGGVAPLGLPQALPVIVDERAAALPFAFAGGGSEDLLLRLNPDDIIRHNNAKIARIIHEP